MSRCFMHQKLSKLADIEQSYNRSKSGTFLWETTKCNKFEHFSFL